MDCLEQRASRFLHVTLLGLTAAAVPAAGQMLYWTDNTDNGSVRRSSIDGSGVQTLFSNQGLTSVALDIPSNSLYYANWGLHRANLDGSGNTSLGAGGGDPPDVALDTEGGMVYVTDGNETIYRVPTDGGPVETIFTQSDPWRNRGVALDLLNSKVYWSELFDDRHVRIKRADLDGENIETLLICNGCTNQNETRRVPIAVNPANDTLWLGGDHQPLRRYDLDGNSMGEVLHYHVQGMTIDFDGGWLYTVNNECRLHRLRLDGTGLEYLFEIVGGCSRTYSVAFLPEPPPPDALYVDDDAPLGGDGLEWDSAFRHLRDAIAAANGYLQQEGEGIEVRVAGGVYRPDLDEAGDAVPGGRGETFELASGLALLGGYRGLAGGGDADDRDPAAFVSTLSGDLLGDDDSGGSNAENSFHVVTSDGADATAVLDGFTISAGHADGASPDNSGAGLHNANGTAGVSNCRFVGNEAAGSGAGVFNLAADSAFINCAFIANTALGGGSGAINIDSSPTFLNCLFDSNTHTGGNGAAGGMYQSAGGQATLINCAFYGNTSTEPFGGGVFVHPNEGTGAWFTNCILWANTDSDGPSQIGFDPNQSSALLATVDFSCIEGGWGGTGVGNISDDPVFADAAGRDFSLAPGSPCIDAGDSTAVPFEADPDLAGGPRLIDASLYADTGIAEGSGIVVDMGPLEAPASILWVCEVDLNIDGVLDLIDVNLFVNGFISQDPIADLAEAFGVFDLSDINAFVTAFVAGCQ